MTLDLSAVPQVFAESVDGTVGIEEEFGILDPDTLDLAPRFEELRDAALASDPLLGESIAGELISSEIEIRSGRGDDLRDAIARQREVERPRVEDAELLLDADGRVHGLREHLRHARQVERARAGIRPALLRRPSGLRPAVIGLRPHVK